MEMELYLLLVNGWMTLVPSLFEMKAGFSSIFFLYPILVWKGFSLQFPFSPFALINGLSPFSNHLTPESFIEVSLYFYFFLLFFFSKSFGLVLLSGPDLLAKNNNIMHFLSH